MEKQGKQFNLGNMQALLTSCTIVLLCELMLVSSLASFLCSCPISSGFVANSMFRQLFLQQRVALKLGGDSGTS